MNPFTVLCALLLGAASPSPPPPPAAQVGWVVAVHEDGAVHRLPLTAEAKEQLAGASHVWAWSETAPPRVYAMGSEVEELFRDGPAEDAESLRAALLQRGGGGVGSTRLLAAPAAMWAEVPEEWLPDWPVGGDGRVQLATVAGQAWRLRAVGETAGSWWEAPQGMGPVSLTLTPAKDWLLTVTDREGLPLEGAWLHVYAGDPRRGVGRPLAVTRSGGDGILAFRRLPAGGELTWIVSAPGYAPRTFTGRLPSQPGQVALAPGVVLSGRVEDTEGRPVAGAEVTVSAWVSTEVPELLHRRATSDAAGAWEVRGLPAGDLALAIRAEGFALRRRWFETVTEDLSVGSLILHPQRELAVLAIDDLGEPLVAWFLGRVLETTTTGEGIFRLTGLPLGPALLRIEAPGLARAHAVVQPEPGQATLELGVIEMVEGTAVCVVLEEAPPEGAVARVDLRGEGLALDQLGAAVVEGEAVIEHVPPGPVTVTVERGRSLLCDQEITVPSSGRSLEVVCDGRPMRVEGVVAKGDRPAGAGTLLWMPPEDGSIQQVSLTLRSPEGLSQRQSLSNRPPQVEVRVAGDGTFSSDELRPGTWQVAWLPVSGVWNEPRTVRLPRAAEHHLVLDVSGIALRGVVLDESGGPVAGARVREAGSGTLAVSGDDGRFRLDAGGPGVYSLEAHQGERQSAAVRLEILPGEDPEPVVLQLAEVLEDELEITVLDATGQGAAGAWLFVETDAGSLRTASTDLTGRARFTFRPPRPKRLRAAATAGGAWAFSAWQGWEPAGTLRPLQFGDTGSLLLISDDQRGIPRIQTAAWDLSFLLARLGTPPRVKPSRPLLIGGLPPGDYRVILGETVVEAAVRAGRATEITFAD